MSRDFEMIRCWLFS